MQVEIQMRQAIVLDAISECGHTMASCLLEPHEDGFFLYKLRVDPSYRRQGLATQLIARAKSMGTIYCAPRAYGDGRRMDQDALEAWYRRLGFVETMKTNVDGAVWVWTRGRADGS